MASSIASASPSGQGFLRANSTEDTDSWQYVETNSSPAGCVPSPSSSFNGWGIIGYPNHLGTSPTAMSPLPPPTSHPNQQSAMDTGSFQPDIREGSLCNVSNFEGVDTRAQAADLDIPSQFQDDSNAGPWVPMGIQDDHFMFFAMDDVSTQMSRTSSHISVETNSHRSSPGMPSARPRAVQSTDPIKKVRGNRVEKKKAAAPVDNFVVVTPNTIHQQSGKPNPFECFEAARGIQRGRKGPLADKAAESALNIRRMGACFCCRSRKVKCDEERPCKNCKKISAHVPQVVCWQFSDFLPVLFPSFIRSHFKKEVIARFVSDNVSKFYNSSSTSVEPYTIELSSGSRFRSTLTLSASFFVPKSAEVLQHWHMGVGVHQLDLHSRAAVPVGIDPKDSSQREALKKRTREYVHNLVNEPQYPEQVTDSLRGTQLPRRVLTIVQRFAQRSQSPMVTRALAIYVTHYVLTRQLCLTPGTVTQLHHLQKTQPQKFPFLSPNTSAYSTHTTTRILNRQIKAVLDEYLLKETQGLFTAFGSALKPRSRAEWAPCLASFLVLCLLFESIETAADTFVVSEAEIALRTRRRSTFAVAPDENKVGGGGGFAVGGRRQALEVCREIDNLPFRQVAYRFHAVYQTHYAREPGVGSPTGGSGSGNGGPTFNPLIDARLDVDLEPAAAEMAASLRALLDNDDSWHELDFLAADPILSQSEAHPYPRDITLDYTGRLLARFLLSFTDEKYLFEGQY
ncbi:hypothetical protein FHL15_010485 [Xylaria flabelliformis]|uniref:Zn(2)-C6 fungal-type domain-containing protein n=1 Tax=Xylaria flabelliformis TaxID=2512241 RepID=A0A553HKZ3_9PEZI|nr:hypothetical protein FHL15_010485 [Xylaria flabelliformis]